MVGYKSTLFTNKILSIIILVSSFLCSASQENRDMAARNLLTEALSVLQCTILKNISNEIIDNYIVSIRHYSYVNEIDEKKVFNDILKAVDSIIVTLEKENSKFNLSDLKNLIGYLVIAIVGLFPTCVSYLYEIDHSKDSQLRDLMTAKAFGKVANVGLGISLSALYSAGTALFSKGFFNGSDGYVKKLIVIRQRIKQALEEPLAIAVS